MLSAGATVIRTGALVRAVPVTLLRPASPLIRGRQCALLGTTLAYVRVRHLLSADTRVTLDVFNLFNRRVSDIDYYYASRLPG